MRVILQLRLVQNHCKAKAKVTNYAFSLNKNIEYAQSANPPNKQYTMQHQPFCFLIFVSSSEYVNEITIFKYCNILPSCHEKFHSNLISHWFWYHFSFPCQRLIYHAHLDWRPPVNNYPLVVWHYFRISRYNGFISASAPMPAYVTMMIFCHPQKYVWRNLDGNRWSV